MAKEAIANGLGNIPSLDVSKLSQYFRNSMSPSSSNVNSSMNGLRRTCWIGHTPASIDLQLFAQQTACPGSHRIPS